MECQISPDRLDAAPAEAFRALYPAGDNLVDSPAVKTPAPLRSGKLVFKSIDTSDLPS